MATECIEWGKAKTKQGYGVKSIRGRLVLVHRLAYEEATGTVLTSSDCVCHTCDNPSCYNIEHLFVSDRAGNNADMVAKGRQASGPRLPQTRLHDKQLGEMREMSANGVTQRRIAAEFNVTQGYVSQVLSGKRRGSRG